MLAAPSAFMASVGICREQARDEPNFKIVPPATNVSKEEAIEHTSMTITTSTSNRKAIARKTNMTSSTPSAKTITAFDKPVISVGSRPKVDLMDLDIDQETKQPVLQFTAPRIEEQPSHPVAQACSSFDQQIEALEKSGVLSAAQIEILKSIQTQVHAREDAITPVKEAPRQKTYTKAELVSLRPTAAAPKVTTGIARKFAEQRNAFLIGEHVHKTRYHTATSLTEDLEDLSILDKKPVTLLATNLQTTEKSKINPFGPPPPKGKGPSLPAHLLNQTTTADHGGAARAQYSGVNDILAPISNRQSPADVTSTTRPTRRNMINQTGFIALAENSVNAVAASKKGEDPLLVACKRGL